jgi:hypothetical protein
MFHHRPFIVKHLNKNKRYIVTFHHGCPWIVCARKGKDDNWRITSFVQPHTCVTNVDNRKHAQLSSRFISQRLVNIIKNCPLMTVTTLIEMTMVAWGYCVKYARVKAVSCKPMRHLQIGCMLYRRLTYLVFF